MKLKKVSIKDYKKIKELFKRNDMDIISLERWLYLWKKNPFIKKNKNWSKGWALKEKNKIVGHFGSIPMKYFINTKPYISAVLCNWVVDKKYRSNSIVLLRKFFAQPKADFFLNTTPTDKAAVIMNAFKAKQVPIKNLNYSFFIILNLKNTLKYLFKERFLPFKEFIIKIVSCILFYGLKKRINFWEKKFSDKNIERCKKVDARFDYFWKNAKQKNKKTLMFCRNKNWLKWHLDYFLKNNRAWIFINKKNNKINGYAICIENKKKNSFKRAYLIDLISLDKKDEISTNLIGACIKEAKKRNCDIFEFRGFNKDKVAKMKLFKPFQKKLTLNPFYYKSNNYKLDKILDNKNYWSPSYIDGDIIINI